MGSWAVTNEWGVRDEDIFRFVAGKLDDATPSFNLVLTSTYHPPYDINVYGEGYPVRDMPTSSRPSTTPASRWTLSATSGTRTGAWASSSSASRGSTRRRSSP